MKSFSLGLSSTKFQAEPRSAEPISLQAFDTLEEMWLACARWLVERQLCTVDPVNAALERLRLRQETPPTEMTEVLSLSLLQELVTAENLPRFPREKAAAFFRHQRWDFIRGVDRPPSLSEEPVELETLLREIGVVVIGISKRILTIGHCDPWLAHLAFRKLHAMQMANGNPTSTRAIGVVNLSPEGHETTFRLQYCRPASLSGIAIAATAPQEQEPEVPEV